MAAGAAGRPSNARTQRDAPEAYAKTKPVRRKTALTDVPMVEGA